MNVVVVIVVLWLVLSLPVSVLVGKVLKRRRQG